MSNGTERVRAVLISSLPRAGRPAQNYNHFARETATFLSQAGRALTISPLPFKKDRSTGHKQVYTLRLAFRDAGGINVENPGEHVDLADRLSQLKIERIVLKSGVAENAITSLTSLIMRSPLPTRQDLERFQRPCIEIVFRQAPTQPSVPITAPPARIEVQPAVASPAPSLTPPVQTASKELTVPAPVVTQPVSEAAQPALGNLSAEELLSSGRQLNKRLLQKGLTSGIRTEIESWLSAAKARIDIFNKSGEAKDYGDHRKLAEQINKFEVRLGLEKTKIKVKLPARPVEVKRRRGPHKWGREMRYPRPEPTTTQPAAETVQDAIPTCPRRCTTHEKLLGTLTWLESLSKERSTNLQRYVLLENGAHELIHWFEYLLLGNHANEEYGTDFTPLIRSRIQNALKYMKDILKPALATPQPAAEAAAPATSDPAPQGNRFERGKLDDPLAKHSFKTIALNENSISSPVKPQPAAKADGTTSSSYQTLTVEYVSYGGNNCDIFKDPLSGREYVLPSSLSGPFKSLPKRFPHAIEIVPLGNHDPFTDLETCCTKGFLQTAETLMGFIRENRTVTVRTENVDVVYLNSPKTPKIIKDRNSYIISIIGNSDLGNGWRPIGKLEISFGEFQDFMRGETISFRFRPQEHHTKASNPLDFARSIATSPLELEVVSQEPPQPAAEAAPPAKPNRS